MIKYIILFFTLTTLTFSQVSVEEHQLVKNTLADMTVRWNQAVEANKKNADLINKLIQDLQAIKEPSEELIAIMKKYQIYKEDEI